MEFTRIRLSFVNAYLVRGSAGFVLVDTGMPSSRADLEAALKAQGCVPGNLKLVVLTHGDPDHSGNAAWVRATYAAPVALHPGDAREVVEGAWNDRRKITKLFPRIFFGLMRCTPHFKRMLASFERFRPDVELKDGQSLAPWGWEATVLHLPGHSAGSIAILDKGGDLLSGDTLNNQGRPQATFIIDDAHALDVSVARLKSLPATTIHPGHGNPFALRDLA
jgi:glyoxylase-like metal-dependent hydrolase (beta-lactamase superfamily II)